MNCCCKSGNEFWPGSSRKESATCAFGFAAVASMLYKADAVVVGHLYEGSEAAAGGRFPSRCPPAAMFSKVLVAGLFVCIIRRRHAPNDHATYGSYSSWLDTGDILDNPKNQLSTIDIAGGLVKLGG